MSKSIEQDYNELKSLREGAHYSRMDLHTHSPASECSSFRLPAVLAQKIPKIKSSMSAQNRQAAMALLLELRDSKPVFDQSAQAAAAEALWWSPPAEAVDKKALAMTARAWLDDINRLENPGSDDAIPLLKTAFRDINNVLMAKFFPPEYTLRCYIEQIEVVALTDHNHPGYIVPRLQQLGTWFDAVSKVNNEFLEDIREGKPPGKKVRGTIKSRLAQAKQRLQRGGLSRSLGDAETKKNHKDSKKLKDLKGRLEHVEERIAVWNDDKTPIRPLTVLPGTEITVSNVHCLTIYPPDWKAPGRIGGILLDIGIEESIWGNGFEAAAKSSVQRTIDLVDEAGGIAIPAHSNSDFKGLLRLFPKGLALNKVLEHPALLALEKIKGVALKGEKGKGGKKAKDACETLRWLDTQAHAPQRSKLLMFIKGSDSHECRLEVDGTGEDLGMRFTWIKMDIRQRDTPQEVFRALRLALLGGQGRVVEIPSEDTYNYGARKAKTRKGYMIPKKRREDLLDWTKNHPAILGLMVHGDKSYSDGVSIRFNPFMNCIAGADGKSTVLRLVAYAFGALRFLPSSRKQWLPQRVRVFVQEASGVWCVQREGRHYNPDDPSVATTIHRLSAQGKWAEELRGDAARQKLRDVIEVWPSNDALLETQHSDQKELNRLVSLLDISKVSKMKPLLVHQPREIFHSHDLFQRVLRQPVLKFRQIIWATVSPNVPTALDADKIIVTAEKKGKGPRQMEVICGGDLHEDEVIREFLDQMEGGYAGFARRKILYEA